MLEAWKKLVNDLRQDAAKYSRLGGWRLNPGFWVGATYRTRVFSRALPKPLELPVGLACSTAKLAWRITLNAQISNHARIGPGLCLIHPTNLLIPETEIGSDCLIFHGVTMGTNILRPSFPTLGDHVDVYAGACLLGGIKIGDGAKIGANCVVTNDVVPGAVVFPAANRTVAPRRPPAHIPASGAVDMQDDDSQPANDIVAARPRQNVAEA